MTIQLPLSISFDDLDLLMPMSVVVNAKGVIVHAGPTFHKLFPDQKVQGVSILRLVEMRRPKHVISMEQVRQFTGAKLYMRIRDEHGLMLAGSITCLPGSGMAVLNLSFGIAVVDAVGIYNLAGSDFAPTDLTVELLYLVEAKSLAMDLTNNMARRLFGEKTEAEAEAMSDELTGLSNRRALDLVMSRLLEMRDEFALMHLDLDFFKQVNDTKGHAAGDHVLQEVARILTTETRDGDTVARVGGDEFVIILPKLMDQGKLSSIAKRIIEAVEVPVQFRDETCNISASVGVVLSTSYDEPDGARMMDDADVALYASKKAGRAQHTIYTEKLRAT